MYTKCVVKIRTVPGREKPRSEVDAPSLFEEVPETEYGLPVYLLWAVSGLIATWRGPGLTTSILQIAFSLLPDCAYHADRMVRECVKFYATELDYGPDYAVLF